MINPEISTREGTVKLCKYGFFKLVFVNVVKDTQKNNRVYSKKYPLCTKITNKNKTNNFWDLKVEYYSQIQNEMKNKRETQ